MQKKFLSIQHKLLRIVLGTSSVVLFVTCAAFFAYEWLSFRQSNQEQLTTLGKIIADNSTAAIAFQSKEEANEILEALQVETRVVAASLYDKEGELFAKYPDTLPDQQFPTLPSADGYTYHAAYLEGYEPVIQNNKRLGTLYLKSDLKILTERFRLYALIAIAVFLASVLIAYLLSLRLQRSISEPVLALANLAGHVSEKKDYAVRAKKYDNDEVGLLTDSFNHMLEQIQAQNIQIIALNNALEKKVSERTKELEKANIELRLNNEFIQKVIDSSIDIIAVFDRDLNYIILNKSGVEIYGVQLKDVVGRNLLEVFPQVEGSEMYHDLQAALKGNLVHNANYRSRISSRIMENFYIPIFNKHNEVYNILVIGHDITDITETNEKLKSSNEALEKSNKDLEQFAYVASHDLQEPLRKIQTFSALLEKRKDDKEKTSLYLEKIVASAHRMSNLINAVLNYSQLNTEEAPHEKVDLNAIIDNIKNDFEISIKEKNAVIEHNHLPEIEGIELQVNQLFYNLISNSLKFSERKPVITISSFISDEKEISSLNGLAGDRKYVKIIFQDNGIGFEKTYAEKVFTIFQRLHSRDAYPGTGIGLALCKKIVDNHNGFISVDSQPGEGTTFTIYLPLYMNGNI